jgi:membrane associated rhomboid family serine protease
VRDRERDAPLTKLLVVSLVGVFAWQVYTSVTLGQSAAQQIFETYALSSQVYVGEFYRVFTSMWLHSGIAHLGSNITFLYIMGKPLERRIGSLKFLMLYIAAGIFGAAGGVVALGDGIAVGASGAIMGVVAAATLLVPTDSMLKEVPVLRVFDLPVIRSFFSVILLGSLFVFQETLLTFIEFYTVFEDQVGHSAHFGGILAGAFLAYLWEPGETVESFKVSLLVVPLAAALIFLTKFTLIWYGAAAALLVVLVLFRRKREKSPSP